MGLPISHTESKSWLLLQGDQRNRTSYNAAAFYVNTA